MMRRMWWIAFVGMIIAIAVLAPSAYAVPVVGGESIDGGCPPGVVDPSAVGQAVADAIAGSDSSDAFWCATFPGSRDDPFSEWPWLIHFSGRSGYDDYQARIAHMINQTNRTFSYSRLHPTDDFPLFSKALLKLNKRLDNSKEEHKKPVGSIDRRKKSVGSKEEEKKPVGSIKKRKRPVLRFNYYDGDAEDIWNELTQDLRNEEPSPSEWNIVVAVRVYGFLASVVSWNHAKLAVRDEIEVISSSFESSNEELGIHIVGRPSAAHAEEFFDMVWARNWAIDNCHNGLHSKFCKPKSKWEDLLPPPVPSPELKRTVYLFSLGRGEFAKPWGKQWSADDAFFAALRAAKNSAFISQCSFRTAAYVKVGYPTGLLKSFADAAAEGTDLKLLINADCVPEETWEDIAKRMEEVFNNEGLSEEEKGFAHCRVRLAPRNGGGHEKFYMMDNSFYIGSQNLFPSGLRSPWLPELHEHGFFVDTTPDDNSDLYDEVVEEYVGQKWKSSKDGIFTNPYAPDCHCKPHTVVLDAYCDEEHNCIRQFDITLNFHNVNFDQTAKVEGSTTCDIDGTTVDISIEGEVYTDKRFVGSISSSLGGDTDLNGILEGAMFDTAFSDLEMISGMLCSGTVRTGTLENENWARSYGGSDPVIIGIVSNSETMRQTADGGYIVVGRISLSGNSNIFVMQLDSIGEIEWANSYDILWFDHSYSIQQTSDGYIVGLYSEDPMVMKLEDDGAVEWIKKYGYPYWWQHGFLVEQTTDGGYIALGSTVLMGSPWVLKLNAMGDIEWQKSYDELLGVYPTSLQPMPDGGYIMVGNIHYEPPTSTGSWILKLDSSGGVDWAKTVGEDPDDRIQAVHNTEDGGCIVAASIGNFSTTCDAWVLKFDGSGNIEWEKRYDTGGSDAAFAIQETEDSGYIVAGTTDSIGGSKDAWVMKLDSSGNIEWQKGYGGPSVDGAHSIQKTTNGYIVGGGWEGDIWMLHIGTDGTIVFDPSSGASSADTNAVAIDTSATVTDLSVTSSDTAGAPVNVAVTVTDVTEDVVVEQQAP